MTTRTPAKSPLIALALVVIIAGCTSAYKGSGLPSEDGGPDSDSDTGSEIDTDSDSGSDTPADWDKLPDWSLTWARHFRNAAMNLGADVARCGSDAVVITGWFSGSISFEQAELDCPYLMCMFLVKVDLDGAVVWATSAGGITVGRNLDTRDDPEGGCRVAVTGRSLTAAVFGLGEPGEASLDGEGAFQAVYEPDGSLAWVRSFSPTGISPKAEGQSIAFAADGSVFGTGHFRGQAVLGEGSASETILVADGEPRAFLVLYDPEGELIWARREGGPAWTQGMGIATMSDGDFFLVGTLAGEAVFGLEQDAETTLVPLGDESVFLARFSMEGDLEWVIDLEVDGGLLLSTSYSTGFLSLLDNGDVAVSGCFLEGTMPSGNGEAVEPVAGTPRGLFLSRYSADGTRVWSRVVPVGSGRCHLGAVTELGDGTLVAPGFFSGDAVFGIGEPEGATTLPGSSIESGLLSAWSASGQFLWALRQGGFQSDRLGGIVSFADDNYGRDTIITIGFFRGLATYGTSSADEQTFTSTQDNYDIILLRFDREGQ